MNTIFSYASSGAVALHPANFPKKELEAFTNCISWAQYKARLVNQDPTSQQYYDAMTLALNAIGWPYVDFGVNQYTPDSGQLGSLGTFLQQLIDKFIGKIPVGGSEIGSQFKGALQGMGNLSSADNPFMNAWWKKNISYSNHYMNITQLYSIPGIGTTFGFMQHITFDTVIKQWEDIFKPESVQLQAKVSCGLTTFNSIRYQAVKDKLIDDLFRATMIEIKTAQIDI